MLCGWAASVLPWKAWTTFAIVTGALGLVHAMTLVLAVLGHRARAPMWRVQAMVSLGYLAYLTWNLVVSASYIAALYGGLGRGVAVSLGLVWCLAAFVTVPLSAWGLAVTGGIRARRRAGVVATLAVVGLGVGGVSARASAQAQPLTAVDVDADQLARSVGAVAPRHRGPAPSRPRALVTTAAASCEQAPEHAAATVFVTWLRSQDGDGVVEHDCVQGPTLDAALSLAHARLAGAAAPGPIAIDVVTATRALQHLAPIVDGMLLRPGLDGVCEGERCLVPWQLLALDAFTASRPLSVVPEFRFGFDAAALRHSLWPSQRPRGEIEGLVRFETASFVIDDDGVHRLRRLREAGPGLDAEHLHRAKLAAERYILSAQADDGRFEYRLDPFVGRVGFNGFSLARQAGTTLVVCELAEDRERARGVATEALAMLVSTQRRHGELAALAYPAEKDVSFIGLGDTALATIALLSCRDLVGDRFDDDIDRMTRFLLAMQRDDGGFFPRIDIRDGAPQPGPDPLYAVGQAVFALTLLERLQLDAPALDRFAEPSAVRDAVERAMAYIAEDYWSMFAADFFFMEENWHCLAARASLGHHRHDGYERFCLDYVRYKTRLIFGPEDDVDVDFVGGYGFSNVLTPHNTGSSGFGEAAAAALAIAAQRGDQLPETAAALRHALGFLLHHQWNPRNAFATSGPHPIAGGISENMASPHIRIDYVQHAMAAMGHGGAVLGLLAPTR
ncbi:MAG: hypothetical protein IPN32_11090 [Deltaproteobacteria bacterium]|nr:hypothetical protein [Deltaproteobacteria bacterium]